LTILFLNYLNNNLMACTSCKKKKGIGSLSSADKAELEEAAWIAAGAVGSKIVVNPIAKAIFGEGKSDYAPGMTKLLISAVLWYADTKETRAMAKGAAAVGVLDILDKKYPKIFQQFMPSKGNAAPAGNPSLPAATSGINGGVILDLDNVQGVGRSYGADDRPSGRGMLLNR
jgi:hypothetical protein